jgi:hypothetical protein
LRGAKLAAIKESSAPGRRRRRLDNTPEIFTSYVRIYLLQLDMVM